MADRNHENPQWIHIAEAAAYCGLSLETYLKLSRRGVLPEPFQPGLALIDVAALDRALDRLGCGLDSELPQLIIDEECESPSTEPEAANAQARNRDRWSLALLGLFGLALFILLKSIEISVG